MLLDHKANLLRMIWVGIWNRCPCLNKTAFRLNAHSPRSECMLYSSLVYLHQFHNWTDVVCVSKHLWACPQLQFHRNKVSFYVAGATERKQLLWSQHVEYHRGRTELPHPGKPKCKRGHWCNSLSFLLVSLLNTGLTHSEIMTGCLICD